MLRPAGFTKVDEAIAKAEVLNKDDYKDYSKVDTMSYAINEALATLEKKEAVTPDKSNSEKADSPKTGDTTYTIGWLGFAALSILASTLVKKM